MLSRGNEYMSFSILVVEDNTTERQELVKAIRRRFSDIRVQSARSSNEAIKKCNHTRFDILIIDINLGLNKMSGLDLLETLNGFGLKFLSIAITGYPIEYGYDAGKIGFDRFIMKPIHFDKLFRMIQNHLKFIIKSPPRSFARGGNKEKNPVFDVFFAHNSLDKHLVEKISEILVSRGVRPWLDKKQIPPGHWFQDVIQKAIHDVKSAAIFIGPHGLGSWQVIELRSFISQCIESNIPVIPVLLPGVQRIPKELIFLKELNWVKFKKNVYENKAIEDLCWGITGIKDNQ